MAVEGRFPSGRGDERGDVLDLTLHRIGMRVAALTTPTAVEVDDAEALGQLQRKVAHGRAIAQNAGGEDDGPAATDAIKSDAGAVGGFDVAGHADPPRISWVT